MRKPAQGSNSSRVVRFLAWMLVVFGTVCLLATLFLFLEFEDSGCGKNLPSDLRRVFCTENPGALAGVPFVVAFYTSLLLAILTLPTGLLWLRFQKNAY